MTTDLLPSRIAAKIVVADDGCWLWTGARSANGYGSVAVDGKVRSAHRTVYELLVGPVPESLQLDHTCRVRHCVRPGHLEPVTGTVNQLRSPLTALGRTHCKHGHPLAGENLRVRARNGRPRRICVTCEQSRPRRRVAAGPPKAHGTCSSYSYYRCRCADCRAAWSAYMRDYYARNGRSKAPAEQVAAA